MRKVTAGLFHSVDGVVSDPYRFQFDSFDNELGAGLTTMMETVDTVVLGRVSYQEWAAYWPNASVDEDFAAFINPVEKFVASRTLAEPLEWHNSRLMDAPLEEREPAGACSRTATLPPGWCCRTSPGPAKAT